MYNEGVKKAFKIGQSMSQKSLCYHMLRGFCRRRDTCEYSHDTQNIQTCTRHGSSCDDQNCNLRHPKLCTFFMQLRCHFGHRCLLFHPKESETLPSVVQRLQGTVKKLEEAVTKLWRKVEALKRPEPEPQPPDPEPPTALLLAAHTEQEPPDLDPLPDLEMVVSSLCPSLAHPGAGSEQVLPIPTDTKHISPDPDTERLSPAKFEFPTNVSVKVHESYTCKVCSSINSQIWDIQEYLFGPMTVTCRRCGNKQELNKSQENIPSIEQQLFF
jgi:hypothetical protein